MFDFKNHDVAYQRHPKANLWHGFKYIHEDDYCDVFVIERSPHDVILKVSDETQHQVRDRLRKLRKCLQRVAKDRFTEFTDNDIYVKTTFKETHKSYLFSIWIFDNYRCSQLCNYTIQSRCIVGSEFDSLIAWMIDLIDMHLQ